MEAKSNNDYIEHMNSRTRQSWIYTKYKYFYKDKVNVIENWNLTKSN